MKSLKTLAIIVLTACSMIYLESCESVYSLRFTNMSEDTLIVYVRHPTDEKMPRDTALTTNDLSKIIGESYKRRGKMDIPPQTEDGFYPGFVPYCDRIESYSPSDTASVFVLTKRIYQRDGRQISDTMVLARYDFSSQDAKALSDKYTNILISYPPNDAMRRIRMWPTFDSITRRERKK